MPINPCRRHLSSPRIPRLSRRSLPVRSLRPWPIWQLVLPLLLCAMLGGCGETGPTLIRVRGTVTFQGQPLPIGMIVFEPDPAKQTRGPEGYASIRNGQFDTQQDGKGAVAGAHLVRITGGDGVNPEAFSPFGNLLFEEQVLQVEIAPDQPPLQLTVPATTTEPPR